MEITTTPSCRVGWEGSTLHYKVLAKGAAEVLVPEPRDGLEFEITGTKQVPGGVEAQLQVKVVDSQVY